jgi:signal transduction histidine kinase
MLALNSGIVLLCFVFLLIAFVISYWEITTKHSHNLITNKQSEAVSLIEGIIEHASRELYVLKAATGVFESNLLPEERLSMYRKLAMQAIVRDDEQYNCYFAYEPRLSQKYFGKSAFILTTHKNLSQTPGSGDADVPGFVTEKWYEDTYQKDENEVWYHAAKRSRGVEFSPIYFDKTYMKQWMITAALGIYDGEKFEGMVGIDVLLDSLFGSIENIRLGESGGICLVREGDNVVLTKMEGEKAGFVAAPTRMESSLQKLFANNRFAEVFPGTNGVFELTGENGDSYLVSIAKAKGVPWNIVTFQSREELYAPVFQTVIIFAVISVLFLIPIHFVIRKLMKAIVDPMKHIMENGISKIESGDYDVKLRIDQQNEFGMIANAFEKMARNLNETTVSRDLLVREMEQRRQAEDESRRIRQQLEFILGATRTGLDIIDTEFNVRYIDPEWAKVYGDPAGKKCYEYFMDRSEVCPECGVTKALSTKEIAVTEEVLVKEGNRPVQVTTIPYQDENGEWLVAEINADIAERKNSEKRLEELNKELQHASLQAGMAEVASGVLHNLGNVLNSVNVSASFIVEKLDHSEVANLCKVISLLREHDADMVSFLTEDPRGKRALEYLARLGESLTGEHTAIRDETDSLVKSIDHIKEIVRMQQDYARTSGLVEMVAVEDLVEDALRLNGEALKRHQVPVERKYSAVPQISVQKHKVLQILINLIRNAKYAMDEMDCENRLMTISIKPAPNDNIRISVSDTGIGIPSENLTKIFAHGFTTRKDGHGFGLHISALAAQEMGGTLSVSSEGSGKGATFVLELPTTLARTPHERD